MEDVDRLAQVIRKVNGNNSLGAGALAEKLVEAGYIHKAEVSNAIGAAWSYLNGFEERNLAEMGIVPPTKANEVQSQ